MLKSSFFDIKVATQDWHPQDHISFASNHEPPNNKPFESFIDMPNLVAGKPQESMKQRLWPVHCVQGTKGAELVDGLATDHVDIFIKKGTDARVEMYSAFADSFGNLTAGAGGVNEDLAYILMDKSVTDVYVVGIAGDYCVKYTAIDAAKAGFSVTLVSDVQRCVDPSIWDTDVCQELIKKSVQLTKLQDLVL